MKNNLLKLNKVELRDVWGHEAIDFTNWLVQQENPGALSEKIGVVAGAQKQVEQMILV